MRSLLFLIFCACACVSISAHAASFDCNKATTQIETAICTNTELSKLDEELGKAYATALHGERDKVQFVRDSQKSWVAIEQKQCSNDVECLSTTYKARIAALQEGGPRSWTAFVRSW